MNNCMDVFDSLDEFYYKLPKNEFISKWKTYALRKTIETLIK